jgi:transcriptional regulator with XRE-family HTH domain
MAASSGSFGDLLRWYRTAAGLTQEELAERERLRAQGISHLERGVRQTPHPTTVALLAEALELTAEQRAAFKRAARAAAMPGAGPAGVAGIAATHPPVLPLIGRHGEVALLERHLTGWRGASRRC